MDVQADAGHVVEMLAGNKRLTFDKSARRKSLAVDAGLQQAPHLMAMGGLMWLAT